MRAPADLGHTARVSMVEFRGRVDGDPRVYAPELFAKLTRREQIVVSRLSEAREAGRIYGLPGPAERADLVRYPSREAAAAAAQELVTRGVAKANLAWALPGWMASALVALICTMMRAWPVIVSALVVIAVMLVVTAQYFRRLREVRRWSEEEFGRLADLDETDLPAVRHPADPANPRPLSLIAPAAKTVPTVDSDRRRSYRRRRSRRGFEQRLAGPRFST